MSISLPSAATSATGEGAWVWGRMYPDPPSLSSLHCRHSEDTALFILKEVYEEMNPELIKS